MQNNAGTHATRRNIAIAIPLAFNKRLQQRMRSTTLDDEDGLKKEFTRLRPDGCHWTSETRLAVGKCAPDLLFAPDLLEKCLSGRV